MGDNRRMPSVSAIREYWVSTDLWERMGSPGDSDLHRKGVCMACGMPGGVFRCHILARVLGGSDDVDNIHILCKSCHDSSEYLKGDDYWTWFLNQDWTKSGPITLARNGISVSKIANLDQSHQHIVSSTLPTLGEMSSIHAWVQWLYVIGVDIRI